MSVLPDAARALADRLANTDTDHTLGSANTIGLLRALADENERLRHERDQARANLRTVTPT